MEMIVSCDIGYICDATLVEVALTVLQLIFFCYYYNMVKTLLQNNS